MKKVGLLYSTKYGQTKKIMEYIGEHLQTLGLESKLLDINEKSQINPNDFNLVILGFPVFASRFPKKIIQWVNNNRDYLVKTRSAFFSVSLNAADKRPEARKVDRDLLEAFSKITGWSPSTKSSFAGSLNYPAYAWFIKFILKRIAKAAGGSTDTSKRHEYTNWRAVEEFASAAVRDILKEEISEEFQDGTLVL